MTAPAPPPDAIQRVLFLASAVHVYNIPPLTSNKGYNASTWTADNNERQIFTARLRVIETAIPNPSTQTEKLSTEILLEDPSTAQLFAAAPYTDPKVVEPALNSSRFFAVRVVGDGGMKATLGIGFEERGESIDFGICLQECRKVLGMDGQGDRKSALGGGKAKEEVKKDWSLKEGQTIKVDVGTRGRRKDGDVGSGSGSGSGGGSEGEGAKSALFSIRPPPGTGDAGGGGVMPMLAPPPSASEARANKRRSRGLSPATTQAAQLGFDDGEFGEFQ